MSGRAAVHLTDSSLSRIAAIRPFHASLRLAEHRTVWQWLHGMSYCVACSWRQLGFEVLHVLLRIITFGFFRGYIKQPPGFLDYSRSIWLVARDIDEHTLLIDAWMLLPPDLSASMASPCAHEQEDDDGSDDQENRIIPVRTPVGSS